MASDPDAGSALYSSS